MDPISFTIGVVSIASIFQTCLHGYRSLNTAMAMGDAALTLNVQFRVEELRLKMWGRNWGLPEESKEAKDLPDKSSGSDSVEESSKVDKREIADTDRAVGQLDLVDGEFEIPGLRDLTIEVLGRINKVLEDWRKVGEKYSTQLKRDIGTSSDDQVATQMLSNIATRQRQETKAISKQTKITSKIRWALKDKQDLEELLGRLTGLNDSLEKLLPRKERTSLARGLVSELLGLLENGSMEASEMMTGDLSLMQGPNEAKAARIVRLKLSNMTERPEKDGRKSGEEGSANREGPTPFAKPETWLQGASENMKIPFDHFVRLAEPKLKDYQTRDGERSHGSTGNYIPLPRSMAVYAPEPNSSETLSTTQASIEAVPQVTLIEWRPSAHESRKSELTEEQLKERRDHIARLLHRTSITDGDFRILDCLGYTATQAHVADGSTRGLVGYVYKLPEFASQKSLPISLRDLLGEAYASESPKVPALEARFKLARELAIALYQLQCAGWVHRKISSYNVIFFKDKETGEINLNQPFLMGWQYSRPDDQRRMFPSEKSYAGIGDLDLYVHRRRLRRNRGELFPRFRKSFDIYSLGVILMEIAFWEPIIALVDEDERERMEQNKEVGSEWRAKEWWTAISKTARDELAPEMGNAYRDATLFCLEGGQVAKEAARQFDERADERRKTRDENDREKYFVDQDFEEVGIEKEFYWKVLKRLERISV